jgi:hypothetical protein
MTNFVKHMMIAAVALVASAALASAQSLTADIPFSFQVGSKVLPAGTYRVEKITTIAVYAFHGPESAATPPAIAHDPKPEWKAEGRAKLAFRCGSTCVLADIWRADGGPAYMLRPPKNVDMGTRIAEVTLRPAGKAD